MSADLAPELFPAFGLRPQRVADKKKGGKPKPAALKGDLMNEVAHTAQHDTAETGLFSIVNNDRVRRAQVLLDRCLKRAASEGPFSIEIELTPELAELLLQRNDGNRFLRERQVNEIARDIKSGAYELNGEALIVSRDGWLNDGQHRCHAVIRAGRSVRTFISFGVTRESRTTVDSTQTTRTPGDLLTLEGVSNGNNVAAVATLAFHWNKYGTLPDSIGGALFPTKAERHEVALKLRATIDAAIEAIPSKGTHKIASYSQMVFAYMLLSSATGDPDAVRSFLLDVIKGGQPIGHPAHEARERLLSEKAQRRKPNPLLVVEVLVRGWNAYRQGRRLSKTQTNGRIPDIVVKSAR